MAIGGKRHHHPHQFIGQNPPVWVRAPIYTPDSREHEVDLVMTHEPSKKTQFLFVEGPSLTRGGDSKSRNTRSALIRRRISEKRGIYRQEEEAKRQELIAQRQTRDGNSVARWCTCRGVVSDQAEAPEAREQPIVTRMQNRHGSTLDLCGTCGKPRAFHQTHGNTAPYLFLNPVSGRADPFSPVDPSLGPGVEELVKHGQ